MSPAVYGNVPANSPKDAGQAPTTGNQSYRFYLTEQNENANGGTDVCGRGTGSMYIMSGAGASYHGVVASIEHRMSSNFVFMANYTWFALHRHLRQRGGCEHYHDQNPANPKGDKGSCGFDFRDIFNVAVVASSHFGFTGWKGQLINHWEISPLVHATDGNPFTVTLGADDSLTDVGNDRPTLNGSAVYTHNKVTQPVGGVYTSYINKAAFNTTNPAGTFGSSGRFAYRGPKFLQRIAL